MCVPWKVLGLAEAVRNTWKVRAWRTCVGINKSLENYEVWDAQCACMCPDIWHKARERKRKPPPQTTYTALPLDWQVSHFLCMHHEFKFGSNFSLWDISCLATNTENSQKPAKKEYGNRKQEFKFLFGRIYLYDLEQVPRTQYFNLKKEYGHLRHLRWLWLTDQLINPHWDFPSCQVLSWSEAAVATRAELPYRAQFVYECVSLFNKDTKWTRTHIYTTH